ncbi:uncharacterized protein LOC128241539 isoform X3 [Mya arenaria]|uniref:uncharacterized protein LOC128241539 isoform X3 n=1 Tax=Mya arenaria TaxID=6604 RepID=UPI0022E5107A|nr:uncharacterized protein LOC128241539 isoform X3 [Mya arenaria]
MADKNIETDLPKPTESKELALENTIEEELSEKHICVKTRHAKTDQESKSLVWDSNNSGTIDDEENNIYLGESTESNELASAKREIERLKNRVIQLEKAKDTKDASKPSKLTRWLNNLWCKQSSGDIDGKETERDSAEPSELKKLSSENEISSIACAASAAPAFDVFPRYSTIGCCAKRRPEALVLRKGSNIQNNIHVSQRV